MELDANKLLETAVRDGIREGIKSQLTRGYDNPLDKLLNKVIAEESEPIRALFRESLTGCLGDQTFRDEIATSVRAVLAKTLVQRFGGELEKQVNVLKSDPTTRARITVAIEEIVKSKVA